MRGKPASSTMRFALARITPADAGKTTTSSGVSGVSTDHPRGCGENRTRNRVRFFFPGSPPRMRGKPFLTILGKLGTRITPADAGKTSCSGGLPLQAGDHPRGCGENFRCGALRLLLVGSPPRMRGKLLGGFVCKLVNRITPADAGKTPQDYRDV